MVSFARFMSRDLQQLTEDVRALQIQVSSLEKELPHRDTSLLSRTTPHNRHRQRRAVSRHSFPAKKDISGGTSLTSQRISDGLISTSPVLTSRVLTSQTNPGDPVLTSSHPGYPALTSPHQGVAYRVGDSVIIKNQVPLPSTVIDNYNFTLVARQAIIT